MAIIGNEDHKQRVNLSSLARLVIDIDQNVFDEGGSLSGFLNRIITSFRETAEASIDLAVAERFQILLKDGYKQDVAEKLSGEYRNRLMAKMQAYPQGDSLMFRLNNHNFDILYEQRAESTAYSAPSKYLKALLEEYARLSPSEREGVYYSQMISQTIQPALDGGFLLDVKMGGKQFWIRPHSLMADPFNSHLYLVGYARRTDKTSSEELIASFRITRLEQVKMKRQSGRLTIDERRQVEKQLQQVGVQYLVGVQDHIKVRLTEFGRKAFMQRSYMRPIPERVEGDVYHFHCAPMQIRNYFLTFGKEAEILEPASLRKEFGRIFKDAAKVYKEK